MDAPNENDLGVTGLYEVDLDSQMRRAGEWRWNMAELDEFMEIITDAFDENDYTTVKSLCVELIANEYLPSFQRAKLEMYMSFVEGEDAGERLGSALYFIADARRALLVVGVTNETVDELYDLIQDLRGDLIEVYEDGTPVPKQESAKPDMAPMTGLGPANQYTAEMRGPEMTLEQKIEQMDNIALCEKEVMAMERENEEAASQMSTQVSGNHPSTEITVPLITGQVVELPVRLKEEHPKASQAEFGLEGQSSTPSGSSPIFLPALTVSAPQANVQLSGASTVESQYEVPQPQAASEILAPPVMPSQTNNDEAASKEDLQQPQTSTSSMRGTSGLPKSLRLKRSVARFGEGGVIVEPGKKSTSWKKKVTKRDLRDLFKKGGDDDEAGSEGVSDAGGGQTGST